MGHGLARWVLVGSVLLVGCDQKKEAPPPAEAPKAAPAPSGKGIDAPGNDPKLVELAKKLVGECGAKWTDKGAFDACREQMNAFRDAKAQKADATCLNFIEDEDVKVRYLGLVCLSLFGFDYRSDKAMAARLVDALEKEKAPSPIDMQMAYAATGLSQSAGQHERLAKLVQAPDTSTDVKLVVASWWHGDQAYEVVKAFAESTEPRLLLAAVQGYAVHFTAHADEACKLWAAHLENEDKEIRKQAVGHLTGGWSGNNARDSESDWFVTGGGGGPSSSGEAWCPNADEAMKAIKARVDGNQVDDSVYVYALANLAKHAKSTPAQKKQAVALLEKIISTKGGSQRSFAVSKLAEAAPKEIAFLKKFAKDPELKFSVENVLNKK